MSSPWARMTAAANEICQRNSRQGDCVATSPREICTAASAAGPTVLAVGTVRRSTATKMHRSAVNRPARRRTDISATLVIIVENSQPGPLLASQLHVTSHVIPHGNGRSRSQADRGERPHAQGEYRQCSPLGKVVRSSAYWNGLRFFRTKTAQRG